MRTLKIAGAGTILLLIAAMVTRFVWQRLTASRIAIASAEGIDSLEEVSLGDVRQSIQIRGWDRRKPLLLFLHGGPGFPQMPFAHQNAELEKDFVVVQWDQRGAGKSYRLGLSADEMKLERFVEDAGELVKALEERFGGKCYLVAHSWGTIVGAKLVARHPELFAAYVAIGQVALPPATERVRYRFALGAAEKASNAEAIKELRAAGPPPYPNFDLAGRLEHWVKHFGERKYTPPPPAKFVWLALHSPAYSWLDLVRIPLGARFAFKTLWRESFFEVDLFQQVPRLEVPVFFFSGRHDMVVTPEMIERYFEALEAPRGKRMIWFEDSGHWPHFQESDRYRAALREVLEETQAK